VRATWPRDRIIGRRRQNDCLFRAIRSGKFDTSGKSLANCHHRENHDGPRRTFGSGLFHCRAQPASGSNCRTGPAGFSKKSLTRRANHWQTHIIANREARTGSSVAGFFVSANGRRPHVTTPHPSHTLSQRRQRAAVRTTKTDFRLAGTRERAGMRRGADAMTVRGPSKRGIRFAPQRSRQAICRTVHSGGHPMTAYLISLALVGLVTIVLWEACA